MAGSAGPETPTASVNGEVRGVVSLWGRGLVRHSKWWLAALLAVVLPCWGRVAAQQGEAPNTAPVHARVLGVVFDSVSLRPMAGATVQLVFAREASRARSLQTGPSGSFAFDSVEVGSYLLGFYHPLVDSLGLQPPLSRVDVRAGGDIRVSLTTPSPRTLRTSLCGEAALSDSTGVLIGYVRSAEHGMGRGGAQVRVEWSELRLGSDGLQRVTPSVQGSTSDQGGVALCGVPIGSEVVALAWRGADSSGYAELTVPASGLLRRDLYVGKAQVERGETTTRDALAPPPVRRGNGTLRGEVRRPDGTPLGGAQLIFAASGDTVTSGSSGAFRLERLPSGTYTLEARALGYLPVRQAIDIMEGSETSTTLRLESMGTYLDTVRVAVKPLAHFRQMREFEERRKFGFGYFLDEDAISKRFPFEVADIFRTTPGVAIVSGQRRGTRVLMRAFGLETYCIPALFIDGARINNVDGDLEAVLNVQDIRAVEVYTRGSSIPIQFQNLDGCGTIVAWTGGRRPLPTPQ